MVELDFMTELYLGVMSGTSLDGVDITLLNMDGKPECISASCFPIPDALRHDLFSLIQRGETSLQKLGELDHQLGLLYAQCVNDFLAEHQLSAPQIRAIGCHGQTIWHAPNSEFPFTTQLGDMNLVAANTGICTIGDFRRKDMAYGGQGAPLVPAFHQAVFFDPQYATVVLNIGGISNISVLIPDQPVIGYDTGVGNALMDSWISHHQGKPFDAEGQWAKTGKVRSDLLKFLLDDPFFQKTPPKSTGRELFNLAWLEKILGKCTALSPEDVQATLLEFTAQGNALALNQIQTNLPQRLLVCGGGARNTWLMTRLATLLPNWEITATANFGIHPDDVEAAAFAWLAHQRIHNLPSNLPSVTGAKKAVSLGVIYPA